MGHIVIIIDGQPQTPPHEESVAPAESAVKFRVEYTPPDSMTPAEIGKAVGGMVKQLEKLGT